ncbi:unnamed protein product [Caenorhabditis auriculariae]|uniref:MAM domain-containing protein n=1 Tax=Caenorhabditis auriculariae TaxID=2777116 RepID=A0A8S1GSJ0_9PELO|nr:unnamed protein product [Caenorhabditis auriculariae]
MLGVSSSEGGPSPMSRDILSNSRARGELTHLGTSSNSNIMSVSLGTSSTPPIRDAQELNCFDFDSKCRWRNVEGLFVDELDWYQGSGQLDQGRLQVATATHVAPDGMYAIAATDVVQPPTSKAVLVSDPIACQLGDGEIQFMYWTSPDVRIKVCVKKTAKVYPDFDFCSGPIEAGDPGPAYVTIPDQGSTPFQIYIMAENFVFNAVNLQGGFAILDSIEYFARMCASMPETMPEASQNPVGPFQQPELGTAMSNDVVPLIPLGDSPDDTKRTTIRRSIASHFPTLSPKFSLGVAVTPATNEDNGKNDFEEKSEPKSAVFSYLEMTSFSMCDVLVCSFNESEICTNMVEHSDWKLTNRPVGNPLTGIRGDASALPYNKEGYYTFISGPQTETRLQTPSFIVDRPVLLVFSYHKVDGNSSLKLITKRPEEAVEKEEFVAPTLTKQSRRWFREVVPLTVGAYDYLAFEVKNLGRNHHVGIDEMFVIDERRKSFCSSWKKTRLTSLLKMLALRRLSSSPPKVLQVVSFDVRGTIIQLAENPGVVYSREAERLTNIKVEPEDVSNAFLKNYKKLSKDYPFFGHGTIGHREWWCKIIKMSLQDSSRDKIVENNFDEVTSKLFELYSTRQPWRLIDENIKQTLQRLRLKGVRLIVVSNADSRLKNILKEFELADMFDMIILSGENK